MRSVKPSMLVLLLLTSSLSGCFGTDEFLETEIEPEKPVFDDEDYSCMEYDNETRCWLTHIPEQINDEDLAPLILDLHGFSLSSLEQKALTDIDDLGDEVGAIVLHPEGLAKTGIALLGGSEESWNAGTCCGDSITFDIDDSGFLGTLIDLAIEKLPVDSNRVYITGWSNGCMMAQRLAIDHSDKIAAIACTSGFRLIDSSAEYSPIPIMEIHGFIDEHVLYATSARSVPFNSPMILDPESYESGAIENLYEWAAINGCSGIIPDLNQPGSVYSVQAFTSCDNGAEVRLMTVHVGGHNLYPNNWGNLNEWPRYIPGNMGMYDTPQIIWDFLSRFSKADM